jgi:hypothetical protein
LVQFHFDGPTSLRASRDAEPALPDVVAALLDAGATTLANVVVVVTQRKTAHEDYARLS